MKEKSCVPDNVYKLAHQWTILGNAKKRLELFKFFAENSHKNIREAVEALNLLFS